MALPSADRNAVANREAHAVSPAVHSETDTETEEEEESISECSHEVETQRETDGEEHSDGDAEGDQDGEGGTTRPINAITGSVGAGERKMTGWGLSWRRRLLVTRCTVTAVIRRWDDNG